MGVGGQTEEAAAGGGHGQGPCIYSMHWASSSINKKKTMLRDITVKLLKAKRKKILKGNCGEKKKKLKKCTCRVNL